MPKTSVESHEDFLFGTLAYKANFIEPSIDKQDNTLKFWHTDQKKFVPVKSLGMALAANNYCMFAMHQLPLN